MVVAACGIASAVHGTNVHESANNDNAINFFIVIKFKLLEKNHA